METSTLKLITERIVRVIDNDHLLRGHLEIWDRGGPGLEYRVQEHPGLTYAVCVLSGEDVARWGSFRTIHALRFTPVPGWLCLLGRRCAEDRDVLWRYRRPGNKLTVEVPQEEFRWEVRPAVEGTAIRIARGWRQRPSLVVVRGGFDLMYTPHADGLALTVVDGLRNPRRAAPYPMPEAECWSVALATESGRERFLQARRESTERYLAACAAWVERFRDIPASLPLDGDAYVYEDTRIPAMLFDLDRMLCRLVDQMDDFLQRVPPDNKYVAPASR